MGQRSMRERNSASITPRAAAPPASRSAPELEFRPGADGTQDMPIFATVGMQLAMCASAINPARAIEPSTPTDDTPPSARKLRQFNQPLR